MRISLRTIAVGFIIGISVILIRSNNAVNTQAPSVPTFAGNAQHTATFQTASQNLNTIRWSTSIDLDNSGALAHYGAPLITAGNTVITPVKTTGNGFQVKAFDGSSGAAKYTLTTDYVLPTFNSFIPVYNPTIGTGPFGTRLYYAGRGGTIYYIDNPDSVAHGAPVQEVFYTTLANYQANAAAYNSTVFINTPITADSNGNVFFGFRVQGTAPAPLNTAHSGFARIDPDGTATYILPGAAAEDPSIDLDSHNSAPALSNDETTLYVVTKNLSTQSSAYLVGLDSTTLAPKHWRVLLNDPRTGTGATISDDGTASPTVAPDGDVYFGILDAEGIGSRGFLLHFNSDLTVEKTPGGFGWDYTPAIVPASMVPSYHGPSSYLLFVKYNNYLQGTDGDGNGINRIALLDPSTTQIDPHPSANGLVEMREVLTMIGPTPDDEFNTPATPYVVREWCINTAAVDPATNSIFAPSEDGHIYRWNVATNSFSQAVQLTEGIGEPYVPSVVGPDGTVYTLNGGTLFAIGSSNGVEVTISSSIPDARTVVVGQSLTFTATVASPSSPGSVPTGTVTFEDLTYQNTTPVTTTLASNVPLNAGGQASVTTSSLTAGVGLLGNHLITASYHGDGTFSPGSVSLIQKVHASASTTTLSTDPNPSSAGQSVLFAATVTPAGAATETPTGMVTFQDGSTVLAQVPLNAAGTASFDTSTLSPGPHNITASYYSDTVFASSSATTTEHIGLLDTAVSRKTHTGDFDINLPLSGPPGIECRSGGTSGNHKLILNFANPLLTVGSVSASATGGGPAPDATGAIDTTDTHRYIVSLGNVPNAQYTTITLSNVIDSDGNFSSAVSVAMGVLLGDVNASGNVDAADVGQVQRQNNKPVTSSNFRMDVNVSGNIDAADVGQVQRQNSKHLP